MDTLDLIIRILSWVALATSTIIAFLQTIKKRILSNDKNYWQLLTDIFTIDLPNAIKEVEKVFPSGLGEFKKSYVKQQMQNKCYQSGITYDDAKFDELIEHYISLTNTVNTDKKDSNKPVKEANSNVYPR